INTGEEKTIIVKFNPQSNGIKTLTISIPSNDPDENPYNITLQGEGYGIPTGGGGCFIATACFGDYNHPIVKILREFRDKFLVTNRIGKIFVRWYYSHSPRYAEIISNSPVLKGIVRILLIPFVIFAYLCIKSLILPLILLTLVLVIKKF
ncbi:MAG: hypothetical protein NC827_04455, partial [Candidatus Omnitrophica bacterium]|nr:hypothetical protein [Candidatus Omnitrophota bacterium]MCM8802543.1 hypothetical protein [Candidatus Omnitrophota bacterium]